MPQGRRTELRCRVRGKHFGVKQESVETLDGGQRAGRRSCREALVATCAEVVAEGRPCNTVEVDTALGEPLCELAEVSSMWWLIERFT